MYPANTKSFAGSLLLASCLLFSGSVLAADATPDQVYQAAQAGNYRQAQQMMEQILRDHPNSAKAHFVEAEILAKQGQLQRAQDELNTALRLDPNQRFANPGAVDELRSLIASASRTPGRAPSGGIPWGMVIGGAALVIGVLLAMRARQRAVYGSGGPGSYGYGAGRGPAPYGAPPSGPSGGAPSGSPQGGGYGYGYPGAVPPGQAPGQAAPGRGSGVLGSLATGAAVGAGVVAGEALMNRVLHGGASGTPGTVVDNDAARNAGDAGAAERNYDMGGKDFGLRDANSWDDDDPTRKLKDSDAGDGQTWNVNYPWSDSNSSNDDGGSWDDGGGGGGSDDDWT